MGHFVRQLRRIFLGAAITGTTLTACMKQLPVHETHPTSPVLSWSPPDIASYDSLLKNDPVKMCRMFWADVCARHDIDMQDQVKRHLFMSFTKPLERLRGQDADSIASAVDKYVNRALKYQYDQDQYCTDNYWATPSQTIASKRGDCEDYAILKYFLLRHLDVPDSAINVIGVSTSRENVFLDHAVLMINPQKSTAAVAEDYSAKSVSKNDASDLRPFSATGYLGLARFNATSFTPLYDYAARPQKKPAADDCSNKTDGEKTSRPAKDSLWQSKPPFWQ